MRYKRKKTKRLSQYRKSFLDSSWSRKAHRRDKVYQLKKKEIIAG